MDVQEGDRELSVKPPLRNSTGSLSEQDDDRFNDMRASSLAASALRAFLRRVGNPAVLFVLPDGSRLTTSPRSPIAQVEFRSHVALSKFLVHPDMNFGDGYSGGSIRVHGNLTDLIVEIYRGLSNGSQAFEPVRNWLRRLQPARQNTLRGSRNNIHRHYDIGNEFYSLWLGETMAYTCAYYPTRDATLNHAQLAKMDHVCRKVRLRPDDSVVEAGCGWGSLALHAAQSYGAKVRAFNISTEQIAFAREQARRRQLAHRVEFVEDDYRNISERCDVFLSVGMLEHVGTENYAAFGRQIARCIGSSGRGLIHSIGRNRPAPLNAWITKRIFPGAYPPALREMMELFEQANLSVLDIENLRLHYAQTLHHWRENYEAAIVRVQALFDENFARA